MLALRSEIEKALAELVSQEEGMRFQGLALLLAKLRWPDMIACERKKDLGADGIAEPAVAEDGIGRALACSLTADLSKIRGDARKIHKNFKGISVLVFITPSKVTNEKAKEWKSTIQKEFGYELVIMPREEIITCLMIPSNVSLCRSCLGIPLPLAKEASNLATEIRRATSGLTTSWSMSTAGKPILDRRAIKLAHGESEQRSVLHLEDIRTLLAHSHRIVLQAPAGRGKTTMLVEMAKLHIGDAGTALLVDLPAWIRSGMGVLEYIAGMPSFKARSIDAAALAKMYEADHLSFLLNGWNEISGSDTEAALCSLRELERSFPLAGIIVATRSHHVAPPLAGAILIELPPLNRSERTEYLRQRLNDKAERLREQLERERVLDELTRTPLILSGVCDIFENGMQMPTTTVGVLRAIMDIVESAVEHKQHLSLPPLSGRHGYYLGELANRMTAQGGVTISDEDARTAVRSVAESLRDAGQLVDIPEPASVLSTLCAHHVLVRQDYPKPAFRFEHQQLQELYASEFVSGRLRKLADGSAASERHDFLASYMNEPAWEVPLLMIAEDIGAHVDEERRFTNSVSLGKELVDMALAVDPIFAAELSRLCGAQVWTSVRAPLATRLRSLFSDGGSLREYALAGILACGYEEFSDLIIPMLENANRQVRLMVYRSGNGLRVSTLGDGWRDIVRAFSAAARADFVSEMIYRRRAPESIAAFAVTDPSLKVRNATFRAFACVASEADLAQLLERLDVATLTTAMLALSPDDIPTSFRSRASTAYLQKSEDVAHGPDKLEALLDAELLGATDSVERLKVELDCLGGGGIRKQGQSYLKPALDAVQKIHPDWASQWVLEHIANGTLQPSTWLEYVRVIPPMMKSSLLERVTSADCDNGHVRAAIELLAITSDTALAGIVFDKLRSTRRACATGPGAADASLQTALRQLEELFETMPLETAVSGWLRSVSGSPNTADISALSRRFSILVIKGVSHPAETLAHQVRQDLRDLLKRRIPDALRSEDPSGQFKADLATLLSHVGGASDLGDLQVLIEADIQRVRDHKGALARGAPRFRGLMVWSRHYLDAVVRLVPATADRVTLELLKRPEYENDAAFTLMRLVQTTEHRDWLWKPKDYGAIKEARTGRLRGSFDETRRRQYAEAIRNQVTRILRGRTTPETSEYYPFRLRQLSVPLATIDARGSGDLVLSILPLFDEWSGWTKLEAMEKLLFGGARLPTRATLRCINTVVRHIRAHRYANQQRELLPRVLCLLPFLDDPLVGLAKARRLISEFQMSAMEISGVVAAVAHSDCPEALDFLMEYTTLAGCDPHLAGTWIKAIATLDGNEPRSLLLGFIDKEAGSSHEEPRLKDDGDLASHIAELARRDDSVMQRLIALCSNPGLVRDRKLLARVIRELDAPEAALAGVNLIDDHDTPSVPYGIAESIERVFMQRCPHKGNQSVFIRKPRSSNSIRGRLFEMATNDERRQLAARELLTRIELWRIENGRPSGEPRHPDFTIGEKWPA